MNDLETVHPALRKMMLYYENFEDNVGLNSIHQIRSSLEFNELNLEETLAFLIFESFTFYRLRKFEDFNNALNEIDQFYLTNSKKAPNLAHLTYFGFKIWVTCHDGTFNQVNDFVEGGKKLVPIIIKEHLDDFVARMIVCFYYASAIYYYVTKNMDLMMESVTICLNYARKYSLCFYLTIIIHDLGRVQRNYDLSSTLLELDNVKKYCPNTIHYCFGYILSITNYSHAGKLKDALQLIQKASQIAVSLPMDNEADIYSKFYCNYYTGKVFELMGKYQDSISYYETSIEVSKVILGNYNNPIQLATCFMDLGEVYSKLGKLSEALDYLTKGFEAISQEPSALRHLSSSYYLLIKLYLKMNRTTEAEKFYNALRDLSNQWAGYHTWWFDLIHTQEKIAKGLLLIEQKSMKTNVEAQEIFEKIIQNKNISKIQVIDALIPLISLHLTEYKTFQTKTIFENLRDSLFQLEKLANIQNSIPLKIQSMIIKGKLLIINGEFEAYEKEMDNAIKIAEEYELNNFIESIKKELEEFQSEYEKWQILISSNSSLKERMNMVSLGNYIEDLQSILDKS